MNVVHAFIRAAVGQFAVAGTLLLGCTGCVWAHTRPLHETPIPGATVAAPGEVRIVYDDSLEPAFSDLSVWNAQGEHANHSRSSVEGSTHNILRVALPALPAGRYLVRWVAVAADGHRTQGDYPFVVK